DLTHKMLTFARKSNIQSTSVNIHAIIKDAVSLLERSLDKCITLNSNLNAHTFTILGDSAGMVNVIINLCINSSHAMPQGGCIEISTTTTDLSEELCSTLHSDLTPGEYIQIEIYDSGCGMDQETLRHIYEPFFTTKEVGKGTGLGLAAVYGSIKDMNGAIEVSSQVDVGTCFTIYLPITENAPSTIVHKISTNNASENGLILIIDDEEVIRSMTAMTLEHLGYQTISASNGVDAIQIYKNKHQEIACVILDLIMPQMNGHDTYLELKKINSKVQAIITSGYSSNVSLDDLRAEGVGHFLSKPYGQSELQFTLHEILTNHTS
ncbi:MAG: response regulator, partial [Planctomycetes bacterium]|nr:response regulator [Planctomycetota bacterium]